MKNVLNISRHDTTGRRFNNLDASAKLAEHGWSSKNCSWSTPEGPQEITSHAKGYLHHLTTKMCARLATLTGDLNGYYRNANCIKSLPYYQQADVLHFHIVHDQWLSLHDLCALARDKPIVWTWHAPYIMTGHCIYPIDCDSFERGCVSCPQLDAHFPIMVDRARVNLHEKLEAVKKIDPLVIVASDYMEDMVARSVFKNQIRLKKIPFGVEFDAPAGLREAKARLGIPEENVVFGFRAVWSAYKGTTLILQALTNLVQKNGSMPITIIAFQEKGICKGFDDKVQVIEAGWVTDKSIQEYYSAMDYFLMPSKVEAFGMMAIEAMAAGAYPIVTHGTALPGLVQAPIHGIAVEHTVDALQDAILSAILTVEQRRATRPQRIEFARQTYSINAFCKELASTYDEETEYSLSHRYPAR